MTLRKKYQVGKAGCKWCALSCSRSVTRAEHTCVRGGGGRLGLYVAAQWSFLGAGPHAFSQNTMFLRKYKIAGSPTRAPCPRGSVPQAVGLLQFLWACTTNATDWPPKGRWGRCGSPQPWPGPKRSCTTRQVCNQPPEMQGSEWRARGAPLGVRLGLATWGCPLPWPRHTWLPHAPGGGQTLPAGKTLSPSAFALWHGGRGRWGRRCPTGTGRL